MKKIIILSIILILGISLMAFAKGAEKIKFVAKGGCEATGFVIFNTTPNGATETTIQIQIRGLDPKMIYDVYSGSNFLGSFETNKKGNGKLHRNLPLGEIDEEDLGLYINIWTEGKGVRLLRALLP